MGRSDLSSILIKILNHDLHVSVKTPWPVVLLNIPKSRACQLLAPGRDAAIMLETDWMNKTVIKNDMRIWAIYGVEEDPSAYC
jgi:hypothetical protein